MFSLTWQVLGCLAKPMPSFRSWFSFGFFSSVLDFSALFTDLENKFPVKLLPIIINCLDQDFPENHLHFLHPGLAHTLVGQRDLLKQISSQNCPKPKLLNLTTWMCETHLSVSFAVTITAAWKLTMSGVLRLKSNVLLLDLKKPSKKNKFVNLSQALNPHQTHRLMDPILGNQRVNEKGWH